MTIAISKPSVEVTENELVNICMGIEKSQTINLVTKTLVRMNKGGNVYHDKVWKHASRNFLVGNEYQTRVGSNMTKEGIEGTFVADENKVGEHASKCVLFNEAKGKHYLQVEYFEEVKGQVEYFYEGNPIDFMIFKDYLVKRSEASRQPQERKANYISFGFDSIVSATIGGTKYVVVR